MKERHCPTEVVPASESSKSCTISQEGIPKDVRPEPRCSESGTPTSSISDAVEIATEEQDLAAEEEDTQNGVIVDSETHLEQEETSLSSHSQGDNQAGVDMLNPSVELDSAAPDVEPQDTTQVENIACNLDDSQQQVPESSESMREQEQTNDLHIKSREFPSDEIFIDRRKQNDKEIVRKTPGLRNLLFIRLHLR